MLVAFGRTRERVRARPGERHNGIVGPRDHLIFATMPACFRIAFAVGAATIVTGTEKRFMLIGLCQIS